MAQIAIDSLIRASELALLGVGLTMVFGVVKFANIAHVEFATLGAFLTLAIMSITGGNILLAGVLSVVLVGLVGVLLYRSLYRRLLRSGAVTAMIGSLALSIVIRALLQTIVGTRPKLLDLPLQQAIEIQGGLITPYQVRLVGLTIAVLLAFSILLLRSQVGRSMRAVAANPELAQASGIDTDRVTNIVWFLSAAFGALAGIFLAVETQLNVEMGFALVLPVFAVAIVGGIGSPLGAIAAAVVIATVETLALNIDFGAPFGAGPLQVPLAYRGAIAMVLIVLVLLYRPQGLFGGGERNV